VEKIVKHRFDNTDNYMIKVNCGKGFYVCFEELSLFIMTVVVLRTMENEVGGACGTHGRGEKRVQGFGGKARSKKSTWKTKV
jgi:hypothetical protein